MATIQISQLTTGTVNGQIEIPATNPLDTSSAPTGTTYKYIMSDIENFILESQGLTTYEACIVATTANLTATYSNGSSGVGATLTNSSTQAALEIDGVTMSTGQRVLVWNQSTTYQNGIYSVTDVGSASSNWVLTRTTDFDSPSTIVQYGVVLVTQGSTYAGVLFQETGAGPFTVGTTAIVFAEYITSGQVSPGTIYDLAYYAASGSVVSPLATANDGVLVTSNTGVPSWLPNGTAGYVLTAQSGASPAWQPISTEGAVTTIDADSGSITPSSGVVTISGGSTGLTTSGSGSTLTLLGTLGVGYGGTGVTSVTTSPTATAFAGWDANSNMSFNNLLPAYTTTATAASTTTLTIASTYYQFWTGSTTQTVKLPHTGTVLGTSYYFVNNSTGTVTVQSSGANTIQAMAGGSSCLFTCVTAGGTTAASWNAQYFVDSDVEGAVLLSPTGVQTINTYDLIINTVEVGLGTGSTSTNTVVGASALKGTSGGGDTAIGYQTLHSSSYSGSNNTAVGKIALTATTSGTGNVAIGSSAFSSETTGGQCVAIGTQALAAQTASSSTLNTIAIGYQALSAGQSAGNDIAIGATSLNSASYSGSYNIAIGNSSLVACTSGASNVAIGYNSMGASTTSASNVAVGRGALASGANLVDMVAIGYGALSSLSTNKQQTVAIGYEAMGATSSGQYTVTIGSNAMSSATAAGDYNVVIGYDAAGGSASYAGANDTIIGASAGTSLTTSGSNTVIGYAAAGAGASGSAALTTGSSNTLIGYQASVNSASAVGCIAIGIDSLGIKAGMTDSASFSIGSAAVPVAVAASGSIYSSATSSGSALPALSAGFMQIYLNGTAYKIALYLP